MNEINETFTKQINGFECKQRHYIEREFPAFFSHKYKVIKNDKMIEITFWCDLESDIDYDFLCHSWVIDYGECCDGEFIIWKEKEPPYHLMGSEYSYTTSECENFMNNYLKSKQNIWQVLQDEWERRFKND